ncbi:unnamed protein product [Oikopleura dioica]|uniref:Uncharacterized protein n=1 Tax=Oikopleura dioica TaxID=34765 RepID=E4XKR6_OIKDI|nr:unnamed protein product [Oikopleura dioica]
MRSESTGWKMAAKNREKPQSQSIPLSQKAPSLEFGSFGHTRENLIFLSLASAQYTRVRESSIDPARGGTSFKSQK